MSGLMLTFSVLALFGSLPVVDLRRPIHILIVIICLADPSVRGGAQTVAASKASAAIGTTSQPYLIYKQPTRAAKLRNYLFDTYGPYPIAIAAATAGIDQIDNSPPEWNGESAGYGKRLGSDFGIQVVSTSTRYALSEVLKQDPLYYRCECRGVFPRLGHAMVSAFTARTGEDGRRVFSFPALVGPYAGSFVAVYAWYPDPYGPKDAFRIGNYSLLEYMGGNVALEFLYSSPRSWLSRMHLTSRHGAPDPGVSQ